MEALTINIRDKKTSEKIIWFLKHLANEGVEIVSQDDLDDLKILKATRDENTVSFDEYLKDEN